MFSIKLFAMQKSKDGYIEVAGIEDGRGRQVKVGFSCHVPRATKENTCSLINAASVSQVPQMPHVSAALRGQQFQEYQYYLSVKDIFKYQHTIISYNLTIVNFGTCVLYQAFYFAPATRSYQTYSLFHSAFALFILVITSQFPGILLLFLIRHGYTSELTYVKTLHSVISWHQCVGSAETEFTDVLHNVSHPGVQLQFGGVESMKV